MNESVRQAQEPYAPYRFTVDDYYRMADADILKEDDRVELLNGQILVKEPAAPEHAGHVDILTPMFVRLLGDRAVVRTQNPVHIDASNDPEPDLAIAKPREDLYMSGHPRPSDVLLLVEIAWTSSPGDRRIKVPLYARAGIPEFWLVDIKKRKLEVYRDPGESGYHNVMRLSRMATVSPAAFPNLTVAVGDILRPV